MHSGQQETAGRSRTWPSSQVKSSQLLAEQSNLSANEDTIRQAETKTACSNILLFAAFPRKYVPERKMHSATATASTPRRHTLLTISTRIWRSARLGAASGFLERDVDCRCKICGKECPLCHLDDCRATPSGSYLESA